MKKKLEAELISIAHRILKLKNKSELVQLHLETQKLYEKLSVLKFVEENFADAKPTIGYKEIEDKLDAVFESENDATSAETPEAETFETETEKVEAVEEQASTSEVENNEDTLTETETSEGTPSETEKEETVEVAEETETPKAEEIPAAAESSEENVVESEKSETETKSEEEQTEEKQETPENTPEPFAHITQEEVAEETWAAAEPAIEAEKTEAPKTENNAFKPSFELAFDPKEDPDTDKFNTPAQTSLEDFLHDNYVDPVFVTPEDLQKEKDEKEKQKAAQSYTSYQPTAETPAKSLNDRMAKGIIIGLNDRIAFMNHLFNNSSEDYNRVLSQLMTIDNFREAKNFIDTMVKPDYNNWTGKEEYEQRFMEIVEKKFS